MFLKVMTEREVQSVGMPRISIAMIALLSIGLAVAGIHGTDICTGESFRATCGAHEEILMTSAEYGRMRLGSCVTIDYGSIGCYKDALLVMDQLCSGQQSCEVPVNRANKELTSDNPCGTQLPSYLAAEFSCLKIAAEHIANCKANGGVRLTGRQGLISSRRVQDTGCGDLNSPWIIEASPGQRINVSLVDFGWTTRDIGELQPSGQCDVYGYISETRLGMNNTLCGGLARERHVYYSASNTVELQILKQSQSSSSFMLQYEVSGCPDVTPPDYAWYKRNGSTAVIGCEWSEHSWHLKCERNTWVGVVGNCSEAVIPASPVDDELFTLSPLLTMGLIVGLGVLVVTLLCILIIGYVCCRRRSRQPSEEPTMKTFDAGLEGQAFLYYPGRPVPIQNPDAHQGHHTIQGPLHPGWGGILTQPRPTSNTADELLHIWETPLPEPAGGNHDDSGVVSEPTYASLPSRGTMAAPCPPRESEPRGAINDGVKAGDVTWPGTRAFYDQ